MWTGPNFGTRLRVEWAVAFDESGFEGFYDHEGCFVEAFAGLVDFDAPKGLELATGETATHAEFYAAAAELIKERNFFGNA